MLDLNFLLSGVSPRTPLKRSVIEAGDPAEKKVGESMCIIIHNNKGPFSCLTGLKTFSKTLIQILLFGIAFDWWLLKYLY